MTQAHHIAATGTSPDTDRDGTCVPPDSPTKAHGPLAAIWNGVTAVIATVMGLAPHVLHHIGLFAGAAFVVGVGGNLLFGAAPSTRRSRRAPEPRRAQYPPRRLTRRPGRPEG